MTLPYERYRALASVRERLYKIAFDKGPIRKGLLRRQINSILRHYPIASEIDEMAQKCPRLLNKDTQNGY